MARMVESMFLYINSVVINAVLPAMLMLQQVFRRGPVQAVLGFIMPPKLKAFDEKEFLKKQGLGDFKSGYITTSLNKTKIHYMETGEENSPLMVCLHGFPEFWYSWHSVMKAFNKKYRVVAVDLRGYNKSDKPEEIDQYHIHYLVNDVREVIEGLGYQQATVVGHDWGGLIAWKVATFFPDVVRNLIILNAPENRGFQDFISDYPWQRLTRFWYMSSFQLPRFASWLFSRWNYAFQGDVFSVAPTGIRNKKNQLTDDEITYYKHACAANIKYPINLYSAMNPYYTGIGLEPQARLIVQPTLIIWGKKDSVLDFRMVEYCKKYATNSEVAWIEDASHWVALDQPEQVIQAMSSFLENQPTY